jgi:uncharacterized membrane protein YoaK (UPF0700 family)
LSAFAGVDDAVGHGHLATAWIAGSLGAIAALAIGISRSLRARGHEVMSLPALVTVVGSGYTLMEAAERWFDGSSPAALLVEPVFWIGLVVTPIVVGLFRWTLRIAVDAIVEVITAPRTTWPPTRTSPSWIPVFVDERPRVLRSSPVSRRGPPVL